MALNRPGKSFFAPNQAWSEQHPQAQRADNLHDASDHTGAASQQGFGGVAGHEPDLQLAHNGCVAFSSLLMCGICTGQTLKDREVLANAEGFWVAGTLNPPSTEEREDVKTQHRSSPLLDPGGRRRGMHSWGWPGLQGTARDADNSLSGWKKSVRNADLLLTIEPLTPGGPGDPTVPRSP